MLVLTRKMGEVVTIGDSIRIKVVEMKGNQVRLGIEAPNDLRIYREEIYLKVQRENQIAASWNLADLEKAVTCLGADGKE
ncbi:MULTISPECIES: carbon storage regulator CsrA [Geobacter]|uniref:Translational regulator CsrA n=2 Tax=Geobacter TaxID=28231 RepID=A0A0C1TRI7_9BACT|nr:MULTISPECIES: carbon storage regulator CsrA [Geobacter]ANA41233.1 carbon storage regulator [Geobacter anodireducens]KIE43374.1 carbon storage regulator [Geobacter soli]MBE2887767.1 carbon storage regulator CsrA [Geobacter anodireducens]HMN01763.1 carbon storage regulator CsrA [Geobacter anodireducens]